MKKKVLLSTLAMAAFMSAMPSVNAFAADDTTSSVYDFSGFNDVNLINLLPGLSGRSQVSYRCRVRSSWYSAERHRVHPFASSQQGHHRQLKPSYQGHRRGAQPLDGHHDG